MERRLARTGALAMGLLVAVTACGNGRAAPTAAPADRGWLGGEPDFASAEMGRAAASTAAAATAGTVVASADAATTPAPGPMPPPQDGRPLRAGSVDDNVDFAGFLDYLSRINGLGITTRPFDPSGRIVVTVTRPDGSPASGVDVTVTAHDATVATVRTTADGTARFLPHLYGDAADSYTFTASGSSTTAVPGGAAALTVESPRPVGQVAVDVLFLLDGTGSMGDEIDRLKTTIDSVAAQVAALDSRPDVRFGMTLYRDLGDAFVTSTFDFTSDVEAFRGAIRDVVADGGGDYAEALDEGFAEALAAPSWRDPATTVQLVFLIADAPPQVGRQVDVTYVQSIVNAVSRGIKVFPIASSESDDQAEAVFRQIAAATGARFVFLAGGPAGPEIGEHTDIASTDYEELPLDALVVRLISEELAALTGTQPPPPTTQPVTPQTNPPGQ
jgi:hypothetical protein